MATVQTVCGPIPASQLGFTLPHEHLYIGNWNARMADPDWYPEEEGLSFITPVVRQAYSSGVRTIIDATPFNLGRDIRILEAVSRATGMHIIASTGVFPDESILLRSMEEESLVRFLVKEATVGVQGTNIRCGVIKCGTGELGFTPINLKMLRACGRAQAMTGLPIITHCRPENTRIGLFQQDILEQAGADLSKVVIGHFRKGDPLDYAENVIRRGSFLAIDQMNFNGHCLEYNLQMIPEMCRRGWADHLLFSHDAAICFNHSRWCDYDHSQYINYAPDSLSFLHRVVIPGLLERGVSQEQIETITVRNPQRLFGQSV